MDPERFPLLHEYLAGLPDGLASYPECRARASLLRAVLELREGDGSLEGLPAEIVECFNQPPSASAWMPEVLVVAVHFALAEADGLSIDEVLELTYRANQGLSNSPMYRAITKVASPRLMLRGASMSWGLLHKGISFKVETSKGLAQARLSHPPGVWPRLAHESVALGFKAVIEATNGRDVTYQIVESMPEGTRIEVRWN